MKKYPMMLKSVPREIIWGGSNLKERFGKEAPFEKIAESWELTVRADEMNVISSGEYIGMTLGEYLKLCPDAVGTRAEGMADFPLLIKFIDAEDRLSIQVHPDDEYALARKGEYGKTEMWYIVDAKPGAQLVYGLKEGVTEADFVCAIDEGRVEDTLNFVDVTPGQVYFIPAGQVHAIGGGILIAEIQQNSNITYRVYDYGRPRELHVAEAKDVVKVRSEEEIQRLRFSRQADSIGEVLVSCDKFAVERVSVNGAAEINVGKDSFVHLLVLSGEGTSVCAGDEAVSLSSGDSVFLPSGLGKVILSGHGEIILSKVN